MKACIIQPPYSRDLTFSDEYFDFKIERLRECDDSLDIIVLPEYSDVPCAAATREDILYYHERYIDRLLSECRNTAKRCRSLVFVNALSPENGDYRNTTYVYDRGGELIGKYFKAHLPPSELIDLHIDSDYTFEFAEPYVLEIEGIRYGFLTCYDFYFYEAFANIARQDVDIIIGCSLQRSDSHDAIEIMCRFLAYNTNAYVIRSSVSFGEESKICGASMVVSPYGQVLANMRGEMGAVVVEFDPADKHLKPAGYGNPPAPHYSYIEFGRKPWQYRPGGSAIVPDDRYLKYPRACIVAGENMGSLASFGAGIALGAREIYVRLSETLEAFDCVRLEDILAKLSCHVVMNLCVDGLSESVVCEISKLIKKYDCEKYVYITVKNEWEAELCKNYGLPFCFMGAIDEAVRLGASKVQLCGVINAETVKMANRCGIICNAVALSDQEAAKYGEIGVDTVITDNFRMTSEIQGGKKNA